MCRNLDTISKLYAQKPFVNCTASFVCEVEVCLLNFVYAKEFLHERNTHRNTF